MEWGSTAIFILKVIHKNSFSYHVLLRYTTAFKGIVKVEFINFSTVALFYLMSEIFTRYSKTRVTFLIGYQIFPCLKGKTGDQAIYKGALACLCFIFVVGMLSKGLLPPPFIPFTAITLLFRPPDFSFCGVLKQAMNPNHPYFFNDTDPNICHSV